MEKNPKVYFPDEEMAWSNGVAKLGRNLPGCMRRRLSELATIHHNPNVAPEVGLARIKDALEKELPHGSRKRGPNRGWSGSYRRFRR